MNKYTKRSLILAILVPVAKIVGILIFVFAGNAISNSLMPPESDDPGAQLGRLFVSIGVMMQTWIVLIVDVIFISILVYTFAYFSHKNALTAIAELSETDGKLKLPKFLRVFSVIEMIISGAAALIILLQIMAIFAFM